MASQSAIPEAERIRHLKLKIKAWEKEFASNNNGRAPGKEDVNANAKIAARYAEFYKLKRSQSSKESQATDSHPFLLSDPQSTKKTPKKTPITHAFRTPSKTPLKTPSRATGNPFLLTPTNRPELLGRFDSPSASAVRRLKWMAKEYVSPTPQKNGKILGLFDTLPGMTPTPPKRSREDNDKDLLTRLTDSAKKSKVIHKYDESDDDDTYEPLDPTTPSRKRRYEFQTPLSKKSSKRESDELDPFATPVFFRQQNNYNFEVKESGSPLTPDLKRFLPNTRMIGKVKPLSALVKELQDMQSEDDPGMEVLREMEQQELNRKDPVTQSENAASEQAGEPLDISAADQALAAKDAKLPVYKKKGQKRQTKRVKIRPARAKKSSTTAQQTPESDSESEPESDEEQVVSSKPATRDSEASTEPKNPEAGDTESKEELNEDDDDEEHEEPEPDVSEDELSAVKSKPATKGRRGRPAKETKAKEPVAPKKALASKKKRTVSANKHQNFCRMDIHKKNRGFKGRGRRR